MKLRMCTMSHHKECVKSQRNRNTHLPMNHTQHSRQPSSFPGIQEQKYDIMLFDQLFQVHHAFYQSFLLFLVISNHMPWHWNTQNMTSWLDHGVNFFQARCSDWCFKVVFYLAVLKSEEALANWVAIADLSVVHKRNSFITPSKQIPCHLAAQTSRSQQQTLGLF